RQAFERFETLEFCAKTIIKARLLGEVRYPSEADYDRPGPPEPMHPTDPGGPPTSAERELRRQLSDFVRRAYQQRLMISTQGAFSARLGDDSFLITPHRVDRSTLEIEDLVRVTSGRAEPGKAPSTAIFPHRAIYQAHPAVQAVVNAYPVNATAFGVTDSALDSRTIPESYLFLRDVARAPFAERFGDGRALAARTSPSRPVVLIENDGVQVCGTSVLDAFDRLEVLETTAEAMINSRSLGPMVPMNDATIAELNRAFGLT
ncbi:MAG: class II aldolase/adducin family protein, partial [Isosphaeraceae bacterium]